MKEESSVAGRTLIVFLLVLLQASRILSQQCEHPNDHARLPIAARGADAPERIPDDVAFAHLMIVLAVPDEPSSQESASRDGLVAQVGLSESDRAALAKALLGLHAQLSFLSRETLRLSATPQHSEARLDELRLRRSRDLSETQVRVLKALSAEGRTRLYKYIKEQVKPRIVVYGDPLN